jgi:NAD(P)-dependent dehydrogenase (short-subunit alcohol dehydrogenase family)
MSGRFDGKLAFVTGATSGIGRATALAFAREGASVVVADVAAQGNRETARMIEQTGGRSLAVSCDVARRFRFHAKQRPDEDPRTRGPFMSGPYWARTSDLRLVEP